MKEIIGGLEWVIKKLSGGGEVLVLNNGAKISPESEAMLQALHSRSPKGIRSHIQVLEKKGSENFMDVYYVGYGDKSIGDCGSGTVFIEGVSMLAAKAIQDWMLYSGQEASTRYIDFGTQPFIDPIGTLESGLILKGWRELYLFLQEPLRTHLRSQFPMGKGEDEKVYEKAIKARCFDITRGFLPAGASTNLSWHSNVRQFADHLMTLRHHPLSEVKEIARAIEEVLKEAFPHSFTHKWYEETEEYNKWWMGSEYYLLEQKCPEFEINSDNINVSRLAYFKKILEMRPRKTELPKFVGNAGTIETTFLIDFGSFRDLQRHRAVIQRMPLLTPYLGFEQWYLEELSTELKEKAKRVLEDQTHAIERMGSRWGVQQYYLPMGYRVSARLSGDLPALVYLVELRSGASVHPTLQKRAVQLGEELEKRFSVYGLKLYLNRDVGRFHVGRGKQDIVEKKPS